jgi:hypothetical protein
MNRAVAAAQTIVERPLFIRSSSRFLPTDILDGRKRNLKSGGRP